MLGRLLNRPSSGHASSVSPRQNAQGGNRVIELRGVTKTYQSPAGAFTALKGIDLHVQQGEFVAVIGKSGSGKSTLINMITGIDRPTSGEVVIGGAAVHALGERDMAVWRGRTLGIVLQFFQLLPTLSLIQNVMLPMDFRGLYTPRERLQRATYLLDRVNMAEHAHKLPAVISGGQQQRVVIARALANDPPILIADEPTGNLDSRTAESMFELFEELVRDGKTIVMVTHDNDLAGRVSRAIIVVDGTVVNQYVASALSTLSFDQLAATTGQLQPRTFAPGTVIIHQGDIADLFYIIIKASVEVVLKHPSGQDIIMQHLTEGQYFGEIGLLNGGTRTATVRASSDTGAQVMVMTAEAFRDLVADSEPTKDGLAAIVQKRLAELRASGATGV